MSAHNVVRRPDGCLTMEHHHDGQPCPTCGYAIAAACGRCLRRIDDTNRALNLTNYGCETCRGKRPELHRILGQEDEMSKAESG